MAISLGNILSDFCAWTSAAGIPHCAFAHHSCLRVFWLIIFFVCTFGFSFFCWYWPIMTYLDYGTNTQREFVMDGLPFPAVSICNMNPYKKSKLQGTAIGNFLNDYEWTIHNERPNYTSFRQKYKIQEDYDDVELRRMSRLEETANDILLYIAASNQAEKYNFTFTLNELVQECTFNGNPCDIHQFQPFDDSFFGTCYNFNSNITQYNKGSGPRYGLRLLIIVNHSENIMLTNSPGVTVAVDRQGFTMFPKAFGYVTAVGFATSLSMRYVYQNLLGLPYNNCTQPDDTRSSSVAPFYYQGNYSVEGCLRSCLQANIIKTCSCNSPHYALGLNSHFVCNYTKRDCVTYATMNASTDCASQCPEPCSKGTFNVALSHAIWPARNFVPLDCISIEKWRGNVSACQKWYNENSLFLEIFFEQLDYEMLSESPAYEIVNLLSDIGGQSGLWMGFSVITLLEFVYLCLLLCTYGITFRAKITGKTN